MFCLGFVGLFVCFAIITDQHNNFQVNDGIVFLELQFLTLVKTFLENEILKFTLLLFC